MPMSSTSAPSSKTPPPRWFRTLRTCWFASLLATLALSYILPMFRIRVEESEFPDRCTEVVTYLAFVALGLAIIAALVRQWDTIIWMMITLLLVGIFLPAYGTA